MSKILENYPVVVEWYTYKHIPRTRHAVIVTHAQAMQWERQGMYIRVMPIDRELYKEFKNEGSD